MIVSQNRPQIKRRRTTGRCKSYQSFDIEILTGSFETRNNLPGLTCQIKKISNRNGKNERLTISGMETKISFEWPIEFDPLHFRLGAGQFLWSVKGIFSPPNQGLGIELGICVENFSRIKTLRDESSGTINCDLRKVIPYRTYFCTRGLSEFRHAIAC